MREIVEAAFRRLKKVKARESIISLLKSYRQHELME